MINYGRLSGKFSSYKSLWRSFVVVIALLCVLNVRGQEPVLIGGILTEDQVWTKDYLYIVTDDIRVPENIELVIESGVTVRFNQGTGIMVELGQLRINGLVNDSVRLVPNYIGIQQWKWRGISFQKTSGEGLNYVRFARIVNAEVGLEMVSASHVVIEHVYMDKNQWRGVRIVNSENCIVRDCEITNNYVGIEVYSSGSGNATRNNLITGSYIGANLNANITLLNENEGLLAQNIIEYNLIEKTLNGIRFDRGSNALPGENHIRLNKFIDNGQGVGFGIYLTMDSTRIVNNIFWHNTNALTLRDANHCLIEGNSFLENADAINLQSGTQNTRLIRNTFVKNDNKIITINAAPQEEIAGNNFFRQYALSGYFRNNTADDIIAAGNFWATADTDTISRFVWDKLDNPTLGLVSYEPYLDMPDTLAPVSPPDKFVKQLVNGEVVFSWEASAEEDVMAYRLHYGPFFRYSFPLQSPATTEQSAIIPGISIQDSVAVTAFDKQGFGSAEQLLGFESPFVFASIIPYAGPDLSVCKNVKSVEIIGSTVPYAHDLITWKTTGDGVFDDINVLYPNYFPGSSDFQTGSVILSMEVLKSGKKLSDSFVLSFIDLPYVFAGNDTILSPDSSLFLATSAAGFYDELWWETTGDGFFEDSLLLHATYVPGAEDRFRGEVFLILHATSPCDVVTDTLLLNIIQLYRISGSIRSVQADETKFSILAFRSDGDSPEVVSAVNADENGLFVLKNLFKGVYSLYAVPDTLADVPLGPAYYIRQPHWQNAWTIDLYADVFDVDIEPHPLVYRNKSGEGFISGRFLLPQNNITEKEVYCRPWFGELDESVSFCQEGLANMSILLFNSDKTALLDYTITNYDGFFMFRNLPYGNYVLEAEKPGYWSNSSPIIALSPENRQVEGLILEIVNKTIEVNLPQNAPGTEISATVFPNPATDQELFLRLTGASEGSIMIEITDLMGRLVYAQSTTITANIELLIPLEEARLSKGVHFLRVQQANGAGLSLKLVIP